MAEGNSLQFDAARSGHFSGMRVIQASEIADSSLAGPGAAFLNPSKSGPSVPQTSSGRQ